MFAKLVEIIIQKLHKVNMKQRSFITIFRLVGECYEQDNSSFRYELLLRKCRDVASSGTCRKADGSWGRSGGKTWNCADCELYCKASRSKNRYGIVAGKAGLPRNNFCTASHGSLLYFNRNRRRVSVNGEQSDISTTKTGSTKIYNAKDIVEAGRIIELLKEQGIVAFSQEAGASVAMHGAPGFGMYGVDVLVEGDEAKKAIQIIEAADDSQNKEKF